MGQTVAVIDYGMGNLHSVAKALEHAGEHRVVVTCDGDQIRRADRVVLPGVGAMRDCIAEMVRLGVDEVVREVVVNKPFLGVCVGMQALLTHSEENGGTAALGLFEGEVRFFGDHLVDAVSGTALKVPHMGWNRVRYHDNHPLWHHIAQESRFYFVHSYYAEPTNGQECRASCYHGVEFCAAIGRDNCFAVQFHPEKSQHDGLQLYHNFLNWSGDA
ncbi:imidazole glycerol phosphate synthase subunit HisH [Ectothiorhodospiraceae bacterium BW-2]|nr:imidazole glycerol phosphate synthase subunit HisH [Ectothiorhodospiraceae bacterium BW-2]